MSPSRGASHSLTLCLVARRRSLTSSVSFLARSIISNFKVVELTDDEVAEIDAIGDESKGGSYKRFNVPVTYDPKWPVRPLSLSFLVALARASRPSLTLSRSLFLSRAQINVFNEKAEQGEKYSVNLGN